MEDLRKNNNTQKPKRTKINIFSFIKGFFIFIRNKCKIIVFWLAVILALNIVFNPKNTAKFISQWYNNFVGTLIEK